MNILPKRYTDDMLRALSNQTLGALVVNALVRGLLLVLFIQVIAFAAGQQISGIVQMLLLVAIFGFVVFSLDLMERAWAFSLLRKRNK